MKTLKLLFKHHFDSDMDWVFRTEHLDLFEIHKFILQKAINLDEYEIYFKIEQL